MIRIQANISGYMGKPVTLLAGFDEHSGILAMSKLMSTRPRQKEVMLICNDSKADRDSIFGDDQLKSAITGYFHLKGEVASDGASSCLTFGDDAAIADPVSTIENDGLDISGPKYRISPTATNAHIAALAICGYVVRYGSVNDAVEMADDMFNLLSGAAVTI